MLVSTNKLFKRGYGKFAIAAINVFTMEQVLAVFRAAAKAESPVIIQTTPAARNYAHPVMLLAMIQAASKMYSTVEFAIHLDHGVEEHVFPAIETGGYTSVMIDASHDPFEKNVARTKAVVEKAHVQNIVVEAELGVLSGVEDDLTVDELKAWYTQPNEAEEFVRLTNCDSLAIAIGTSHGAYKFSGGKGLQFDILKEIQQRLPEFPLVLHGGSGVSQAEIARVNAAGGKLEAGAQGVPDHEIQKAIQYGICKVNIATDARLLWARVHREFFRDTPEQFDPVVPGRTYMAELEKCYLEKFEVMCSTGKSKA